MQNRETACNHACTLLSVKTVLMSHNINRLVFSLSSLVLLRFRRKSYQLSNVSIYLLTPIIPCNSGLFPAVVWIKFPLTTNCTAIPMEKGRDLHCQAFCCISRSTWPALNSLIVFNFRLFLYLVQNYKTEMHNEQEAAPAQRFNMLRVFDIHLSTAYFLD